MLHKLNQREREREREREMVNFLCHVNCNSTEQLSSRRASRKKLASFDSLNFILYYIILNTEMSIDCVAKTVERASKQRGKRIVDGRRKMN